MEPRQPTSPCRVCAWCKRCWDKDAGWIKQDETSTREISHGICERCAAQEFKKIGTEIEAVMSSPANTRRTAADTLYHLARQIELGKVQILEIGHDRPLIRTPGAVMNPDETKRGQPVTFTLRYIDSGAVQA
jgi:hypothetical protein